MIEEEAQILILYYSSYGNIYHMENAVAEGVKKADSQDILRKVPELVLKKYWSEDIKKN